MNTNWHVRLSGDNRRFDSADFRSYALNAMASAFMKRLTCCNRGRWARHCDTQRLSDIVILVHSSSSQMVGSIHCSIVHEGGCSQWRRNVSGHLFLTSTACRKETWFMYTLNPLPLIGNTSTGWETYFWLMLQIFGLRFLYVTLMLLVRVAKHKVYSIVHRLARVY